MSITTIHKVGQQLLAINEQMTQEDVAVILFNGIDALSAIYQQLLPNNFLQLAQEVEAINAELEQIANSPIPDLDSVIPKVQKGQIALAACNKRLDDLKQIFTEISSKE